MDYTLDKLTTEDVIGCGNGHFTAGSSSRAAAGDHRVRVLEGENNQLENKSGVSRISTGVPLRYGQNQRHDGTSLDKLEGYTTDIAQSLSQARKEHRTHNVSFCYENKPKSYGSQFPFSFGEEAAEGTEAVHKRTAETSALYSESDIRSVNWLGMRNKERLIQSKGYMNKPVASGFLAESLEIKDEYHSGISLGSDLKYARASENKQLLCPEPAQFKNSSNSMNVHPDFQFSAMNYREAEQFSAVPEAWNLLPPENYRRQPESFVLNIDVAEVKSKPGRFGDEVLDRLKQLLPENGDSQTMAPSERCDGDITTEMSDFVCDKQTKIKDFVDGTDSKDSERTLDGEDLIAKNAKIETISDNGKKNDDEKWAAKFQTPNPSTGSIKNALVEKDPVVDFSLSLPSEGKRFQCEICKKTWKFKKGLNKHMKTHLKKFTCSLCKSDFTNKSQLNRHLQTHADSKLLDQATANLSVTGFKRDHGVLRAFPCAQCPYKAKQKKDLTKHMKVHTSAKIHKCQLCDFSSKRRYSLHRHLKAVHSIAKVYECTVCDFKIDSLDSFKAHISEHSLSPTTPTNSRGSVIKERANLTEQLLNHTMSQKAKCKKCEEIYFSSVEFMHHLLSHRRTSSIALEDMYQDFSMGASSSMSDKAGSKLMLESSTDDIKMSHMSTIVSRLADVTKTLHLLGDVSKGASELAEISNLATELVVIADIMLPSFKNRFNTRRKTQSPSMSRNILDDSSFMDDDFEFSSVLDVDAATVKEEFVDKVYPSAVDINMQIQVDFNGEAISCIQKDHFGQGGGAVESKKGKQMRCSLCNLVFTDTCGLKRHLLVHVDARPWSCKKCGQSFRRKEHLKKHMVTHSADRPFVCEECHYGAKTEERLKIHISCCHSRNKQFGCQFCSYSGRTSYDLSQHMKRHKPQTCSQCTFVCYSKAELRKHLSTHSSFDCGICEFTTTDRVEYTRHAKKHTMTQYLCCELCGYSCDTLRKFKYHKLRHENKTPFECPDCEYKCSSRASYDCHRLKHAGLKPFLCSFCGSSFIKSSHLNQHMLIHKDEKSFKCGVCGYSCRTKHNMKEHEMTHSGEKPYACKFCNFSSRRKKALLLHMSKHEGR